MPAFTVPHFGLPQWRTCRIEPEALKKVARWMATTSGTVSDMCIGRVGQQPVFAPAGQC